VTSGAAGRTVLRIAALLLVSRAVFAQTVAVSGSPALMRVTTAVAGSEPAPLTDATTTYTVFTPTAHIAPSFKVSAQLNAAMPTGTTLTATFVAPAAGGTSAGPITLDVTARMVVTGIPKHVNQTQGITYQFSATVAAGVVPLTTRTVTITVLAGP
jgi:hypothetical protein